MRFAPSSVIDDNLTVPPGTIGTVAYVNDAQTVHVHWDNGASLGLATEDEWEYAMKVYLVALNGGYEQPEFLFFTDKDAAQAKYDEYLADCFPSKEHGEQLDMIEFDPQTGATTHIATYFDGIDDDEDATP